ncbi:MAG: PA14 domain-containing protein [Myxococcales bacterium]
MKRPLFLLSLLATGACSFQMRAGAGANGAAAPASAPEPKHESKSRSGKGKSVSVSFHKSGSISGKLDWQGRSGQLCRASTPFKFVGLAKFHGTAQLTPSGVQANGSGTASGKTSGGTAPGACEAPRTPVPTPPPAVAVKPHPEPKPVAKVDAKGELKKHAQSDSKAPETPAKPPAGPTPGQLETPKSPPADPPDNVFGYDEPVLGCFEGQVFPLAVDAPKLPASYDGLTPVSVLYACEWDIAPRSWDQGFPGVADRFEWFAIRYAGAFRTGTAGEYAFRISSDDGAKVTIDGKLVVDNDGQHAPREARGKLQLAAGDHQMVLEYFQGPRYQINLQLWVTPPGKPEELFTVR